MFRLTVVLSLVCIYLANNASALITTCPTPSANKASIRLNMTITLSGMGSYPGVLLLAENGNFVFLVTVSDVGSPQSVIQGTWSCSSEVLSLAANTFYFFQMSMSTMTKFTCSYTCSSSATASRSCTATYKVLSNNQIGTVTAALDLVIP